MSETGSIEQRPVPELFRALAASKRNGLMKITTERRIRAVVFESGLPVFAVSNVPEDQLDVFFVRRRDLTPQQASEAKSQIAREAELPRKIVDLGFLTAEEVEAGRREQISRIIQAALLTQEGTYDFDPATRAAHDLTLDPPLDQWLLDAGHSVPVDAARAVLEGAGERFTIAETDVELDLSPLDGFLLSRLTEPSTVDEITLLCGLPEDQTIPALYALFVSGRVVATGEKTDAPAPPVEKDDRPIEEVRNEIERMMAFYANADHYEVLGVTRSSSSAEIKLAYYALAKRFHPDRFRKSIGPELREMIEKVFQTIAQAYDTLYDSRTRGEYDKRIGSTAVVFEGHAPSAPSTPASPSPPVTPSPSAPVAPPIPTPIPRPSGPLSRPEPTRARPSGPLASPAPAAPPLAAEAAPSPVASSDAAPSDAASGFDPGRLAEQNYREGVRRFESRDIIGAVQHLREAVRLAPQRGQYHLSLGMALAQNPRWLKDAERHLIEAIKYDPLNVQILLKLGQIYQQSGLAKRAEAQYRSILEINARHAGARKALEEMGLKLPPLPGRGGAASGEKSSGIFGKLFGKK